MTAIAIVRSMGGLVFDATFKEVHEDTSTVTDNPVETGVSISDHMYRNPRKLTISAGVSNAVLHKGEVQLFASNISRVAEAWKQLRDLKNAAEPFDVQTGLDLYSNMVCTSLKTEQDKETGQVLYFDAELREVIIVNTQTVTYPLRKKGATKRQAGAVKDKGEQQGTEPPAKKKSLLNKLVGSL